ncbi:MAG: YchJ family protein [Caldilineaceae bacterium]
MNENRCPCGSGALYQMCCQPYHLGTATPATPEQLMRARYTAFAQGNIDYLVTTHEATQRQPNARQELAQTVAATEWLSLRVLDATLPHSTATTGLVEFVAFYRQRGNNTIGQLHERSTFVREDGHWCYTDGVVLPPLKLKRNDLCWCGSGKKLKQCHQT